MYRPSGVITEFWEAALPSAPFGATLMAVVTQRIAADVGVNKADSTDRVERRVGEGDGLNAGRHHAVLQGLQVQRSLLYSRFPGAVGVLAVKKPSERPVPHAATPE